MAAYNVVIEYLKNFITRYLMDSKITNYQMRWLGSYFFEVIPSSSSAR